MINANSIRWETRQNKNPCIYNFKSNGTIVAETKHDIKHNTSEFLPYQLGYKVHRNDNRPDCGGVLISVKEYYNQNEVYNDKTGVVQWVEVNLKN